MLSLFDISVLLRLSCRTCHVGGLGDSGIHQSSQRGSQTSEIGLGRKENSLVLSFLNLDLREWKRAVGT